MECIIVALPGTSGGAAFETQLILNGDDYYRRSIESFEDAEEDAELALLDCAADGWEGTRVRLTAAAVAN